MIYSVNVKIDISWENENKKLKKSSQHKDQYLSLSFYLLGADSF